MAAPPQPLYSPPQLLSSKMNVFRFSELRKKVPNGFYIESGKVAGPDPAGRSWRIAFFPNGKLPGTADAVSLYLVLDDDHDGHDDDCDDGAAAAAAASDDDVHYRVTVKFKLYEVGGRVPRVTYADFAGGVIGKRGNKDLGFERFATMKELAKSGVLRHDRFTIGCEFTILSTWIGGPATTVPTQQPASAPLPDQVVAAPPSSAPLPDQAAAVLPASAPLPDQAAAVLPASAPLPDQDVQAPPLSAPLPEPSTVEVKVPSGSSELHADFGRLLETREGADVKLEVRGKVFAAHKLVLAARSPVFMEEFFGSTEEEETTINSSCIRIIDMDPKVFEAMLHYMYTDTLPEMEDEEQEAVLALDLVVAADRYNLKGLKSVTEDKLCNYMDASRVFKMLTVAEAYHCSKLKNRCLTFIGSTKDTSTMMADQDVERLARSCPSLVKDVIAKILDAREETPCNSLVCNIDYDLFIIYYVLFVVCVIIFF